VGVGFAKTAMYAGLGIAAGALALAIGVRELGKCFRSAIRSHRLSKLAAPVPTTRAQKLLMDDLKKARDFNKKASIDSGIRAGVNIAAGSVSIAVFAAGVISGIGAALVPFVGFGIATGLKTFRTWELKNTDYLNDQKELADRMRDRIFDLKSRAIEGELVPDDRLLLKTLVAVRLIPKNAVPADFSDDASLKKLLLALNKIGDSDVNAKFAPSVEGLWHIHAPHGDGHGEESARLTSGSH
ncbi:hypothetical protein EBR96_06135, partial [bacterium]|nr:hypothetical protein [bacterium]